MIIAVFNPKGGTKKSSTVLNLASIFAPHYIIDLDVHDSITTFNRMRPEGKQFDVKQFKQKLPLAQFLIDKGSNHSIIIDCGGFDSELNSVAIKSADIVLIPTNETAADVRGLMHANSILEREGVSEAWIIPNGSHPNKQHFKTLELLANGMDRIHLRKDLKINQSKEVDLAMWKGLGVNELNKYCVVARQYRKLGSAIMEFKNEQ